ncbi:MAG: cytochrome c oxidase assembly protein [Ilumatobacteraceae bacterium]
MLATVYGATGVVIAHETRFGLDRSLVVVGVGLFGWAYWRGRSLSRWQHRDRWRALVFVAALATIVGALVSPLDSMSGELASAHMVQHLLLVLIAAPLLAVSAPQRTVFRGLPPAARIRFTRARRIAGVRAVSRLVNRPVTAWLLHVCTLWAWHAAVPYDAALRSHWFHALEHSTLLITATIFWAAIVRSARSPAESETGLALLLIFAMGLQSTILAALITFASTPWYGYDPDVIRTWGLDPRSDQQLAGAIMWVPSGAIHLAGAIVLLRAWIGTSSGVRATAHRVP